MNDRDYVPVSSAGTDITPPFLRCAIYGRVSTDGQAAIEYNSLQAQEDICKNYIVARAMDPALPRKWKHVATYVDAGWSGGTLDRPKLKELIADIEAGKIDLVVTYNIDRISRSVLQFHKLWELFKEHGVDFVSPTQEFNTTTSQGRLMLNVVLAFAQSERERISERTRDKIAAAKQKGRWVGGNPILGFDIVNKSLAVDQVEAVQVNDIFDTYLEQLSLLRTLKAVKAKGYRTKQWTTQTGRRKGGHAYDKKTLKDLLTNPIYVGKVRHHDQLFVGLHKAIVDATQFQRVQDLMSSNWAHRSSTSNRPEEAVLAGLVRCAACQRAMGPNAAHGRGGRRYVYYVCQRAQKEGASACPAGAVPAGVLEQVFVEQISYLASDYDTIRRVVAHSAMEAHAKLPFLRGERARVNREQKQRREEVQRLVDAIEKGRASLRSIAEAIKQGELEIDELDRRVTTLDGEIAALDRDRLTHGQVASAMKSFVTLWASLTAHERARLARCLVSEIVYGRRNKGESKIRWRFHAIKSENSPRDGKSAVDTITTWKKRGGARVVTSLSKLTAPTDQPKPRRDRRYPEVSYRAEERAYAVAELLLRGVARIIAADSEKRNA